MGTSHKDEKDVIDYRIINILVYFSVIVVIGIPIWWYTTRVYRAHLPLDEILHKETLGIGNETLGLPLSLEYDILITLVNPEPDQLNVDLNGEKLSNHLKPFLKEVSAINKFEFKSQWLFYTELGLLPSKVDDYYVLSERQLPHIITPLETKLWSHLSSRPTVNFIVYFAPCGKPLTIDNERNKSQVNAFVSPRWGGILIMNPDKSACNSKQFQPDSQYIVSTFVTQVIQLFKIKSFNEEDIMQFKIERIKKMVQSTHRTLKSLAQLLTEISRIVISDEVGQKISIAVDNVKLAEEYLRKGEVEESLKLAKIAFSTSESAFSDSSLLALLYFPEDQKYAVYIPLFLPIMIPVFMSLATLKNWWKSRKMKTH
ncbi:unnamed protein product [Acanthoscelides obtectus]|uniref:GPI transamidase component PIG-S n=1 Tax=Acanthoscelides obtectus TaxID=200917 RepID=A0A9P0PJB2_ACAOB|nr:unnamed protein product [Acanthoscelides obtectus]CAK1651672.1 GPI transamidase component PIG-S [Acanthoscelides obtectus]